MSEKRKLLRLGALIFLLCLTLLFTLSSCGEAGSDEVLSQDQLNGNISSDTEINTDYVWEYLDRWVHHRCEFVEFATNNIDNDVSDHAEEDTCRD